MINEKNTAIITYIDEYFVENLEKDFLTSLFEKAHFEGKVIILNYGMNEDTVERLQIRFNVEIKTCEKLMPVFSNRYLDIPHAIDSLDENITHIMLMDSGDIWFQNNINFIFECSLNGIGCVKEERVIGADSFTEYCLNHLDRSERSKMESIMLGKNVINAGVICGPREMVRKIACDVERDMQNNSSEFFGIDQLYFDYEWYCLSDESKEELDEICNYVLVSNVNKYAVRDGYIYNALNKLVAVVHNAGANWRVLKRPFVNEHSNEDQYTDVRKTDLTTGQQCLSI